MGADPRLAGGIPGFGLFHFRAMLADQSLGIVGKPSRLLDAGPKRGLGLLDPEKHLVG